MKHSENWTLFPATKKFNVQESNKSIADIDFWIDITAWRRRIFMSTINKFTMIVLIENVKGNVN